MTENSTTYTPAWAYLRAHEMSHGKTYHPAHYLMDCYTDSISAESNAIRAFAAYIAKHEQNPVDPDEQLVRGIFATFRQTVSPGLERDIFEDGSRKAALDACVAYYKEHKQ